MIKNRMKTDPIPVVRQHRPVRVRNFTSADRGKCYPVAAFGLLRGDSCSGRLEVAVEMNETYEVLFNPMTVRVNVWFVPKVALERFQRNKTYFERSAVGDPITNEPGAATIPYLETHAYAINPIYKHLGLIGKAGVQVTTDYIESYNAAVNHSWRQRSKSLTQRLKGDTALAPALWGQNSLSEIVPNFDVGMISGEAPITIVAANLPVQMSNTASQPAYTFADVTKGPGPDHNVILGNDASVATRQIYAKLAGNSAKVSLANIDQARNLVEMAKLREQYEGHKDPFIIETLMAGLPIDDQVWFMPMLLDSQTLEIKQMKRMATDGANLSNGVANGLAVTSVGVNVPQNPYGGVVMVTIEGVPEQLYERQADPYFTTTSLNDLPRYDRDMMNPMPVVEVKNKEVDVQHSVPEGRFGYARRNWKWANHPSRVGGDLFAPNNDAPTTIDRRAIYATEVADPALNTEFYLATTLGKAPFVETSRDIFRVGVGGVIDVVGLTVIGQVHESEANYDAVRAEYAPLAIT